MGNTNCKNIISCYYCNSCKYCDYCNYCYYCDSCYSCYYCSSCYSCESCDSCYYCYYCNYCKGLRLSERMLFCLGDGGYISSGNGYQKNNMVFNTQVTPDEFYSIKLSLPNIKLDFENNTYEEAWAKAWSDMSDEDKNKILNIPHFNAEIFKEITGIDVEKDDEVEKAIKLLTEKGKLVNGKILN